MAKNGTDDNEIDKRILPPLPTELPEIKFGYLPDLHKYPCISNIMRIVHWMHVHWNDSHGGGITPKEAAEIKQELTEVRQENTVLKEENIKFKTAFKGISNVQIDSDLSMDDIKTIFTKIKEFAAAAGGNSVA